MNLNTVIRSLGLRKQLKHLLSRPNRDAVFVFGMQKSGTSAIAGLLAAKTGLSVTIDTPYLWEPYYNKLKDGSLLFERHIQRYSYPFSKDIIKEPNASYIIDRLRESFSLNRYVFLVRGPHQNIRSILNRLEIPGDQQDIPKEAIHPNWRAIFGESPGKNYIDELASLWAKTNSQWEVIEEPGCVVVRYEEFNVNKEAVIERIATALQLEKKHSIEHLVDKEFQPKGNSKLDPQAFFGEENYDLISKKCDPILKRLGY